VLVAVGRRARTDAVGLERTRAEVGPDGFVDVDAQRRTAEPSIFAIGDVTGEPQLAHKATHEGRVAVEAIAGRSAVFEPRAIPAVVYTDPEIAWCGLTESEARARGVPFEVAKFPWAASGRALTLGRTDGVTKLVVDPGSGRLLGAGVSGPRAGELIAELCLALEMGARAADLEHTIHPHPSLSETVMGAAEVFAGTATDVFRRR
jgi:dihydrolipoamide dehydrogenase